MNIGPSIQAENRAMGPVAVKSQAPLRYGWLNFLYRPTPCVQTALEKINTQRVRARVEVSSQQQVI
jgi:hypothetical protein